MCILITYSADFRSYFKVRQGDNLSTNLCKKIMIFNLCENIPVSDPVLLSNVSFNFFLYADDLVLLSKSIKGLQNENKGF